MAHGDVLRLTSELLTNSVSLAWKLHVRSMDDHLLLVIICKTLSGMAVEQNWKCGSLQQLTKHNAWDNL